MRRKKHSSTPILLLLCLFCLLLFGIRHHIADKDTAGSLFDKVKPSVQKTPVHETMSSVSVIDDETSTLSVISDDEESGRSAAAEAQTASVDSCYAYYYQQLSADEQMLYRQIYSCVLNYEKSVPLSTTDTDTVYKVYHFILFDHPELFWCTGSSQSQVYAAKIEFMPDYSIGAEEIKRRSARIREQTQLCLLGLPADASDYEKVHYVYTWLVNTIDYDENASDSQNIYSSLVGHASVCAGYAKGFQYLLNALSIPCIYLTGTLQTGESHAWNMVQCNDTWYQTDVTFGDPVFTNTEDHPKDTMSYAYLCCTDTQIRGSHIPDGEVAYPACTSMDLNYYALNGWFIRDCDETALTDLVSGAVLDGKDGFTLQCANSETYRQVCDLLLETIVPNVSQSYMKIHDLKKVHYKYSKDADMLVFNLYWVSE